MEIKFKANKFSRIGNSYFLRVPMYLIKQYEDKLNNIDEISVVIELQEV